MKDCFRNTEIRTTVWVVASSWGKVTSDVTQGSALLPILLIICVDDINEGISGDVNLFTNYAKLYC